ncbi:MAG: branched-chain amino acid ABC transporter permease [Halobacteriales archaeon]|nr:branched-chain amino acid ABC transporter permease [Halobacteriales archaeon]
MFFTPINETGPIPNVALPRLDWGWHSETWFDSSLAAMPSISKNTDHDISVSKDFQAISVGPADLLGNFFVTCSSSFVVVGCALTVFASIVQSPIDTGRTSGSQCGRWAMMRNSPVSVVSTRSKFVTAFWALAGILAGLAGVLLAVQTSASATTGYSYILQILAAAILGGAGSPYGAIVGAYIIGLVLAFSTALLPSGMVGLSSAVGFIVLIVVLLVKPSGLTGTKVRKA